MVDRRNLTIPINLGFLAVLVALSALVTDTPPVQVAEKQMPASPVDTMPPPSAQPVETRPFAGQPVAEPPFAGQAVRLSALSMPPLPELPMAAAESRKTPVKDVQRQESPARSSPEPEVATSQVAELVAPSVQLPSDPVPPTLTPTQSEPPLAQLTPLVPASADLKPAALTPSVPLPAKPLPAIESSRPPITPKAGPLAPGPELTPLGKVARPAAPAASSVDITPLRPIARKAPDHQQVPDSTPPSAMPIEVAAAVSARPEIVAAKPEDTRPRAVDLQVAERLMDSQGQQLSLEFLWPADRRSHPRIYTNLTQCLGVENGVIDSNRKVHLGAGGGRRFNAALHSPFMRLVDQPVDPRERRIIERLRNGQHGDAGGGMAVRVFRRAHDMRLLAALNRAFGGLPSAGRVTAEYEMDGSRLYLAKLTLDGGRYDGRVRLGRDGCA